MRKTLNVKVTKEDIKQGEAADCHRCPVARAMRRALKASTNVSVSNFWIRWQHDGVVWVWELPDRIKEFIKNFDVNLNGDPFSFEIPLKEVKRANEPIRL